MDVSTKHSKRTLLIAGSVTAAGGLAPTAFACPFTPLITGAPNVVLGGVIVIVTGIVVGALGAEVAITVIEFGLATVVVGVLLPAVGGALCNLTNMITAQSIFGNN